MPFERIKFKRISRFHAWIKSPEPEPIPKPVQEGFVENYRGIDIYYFSDGTFRYTYNDIEYVTETIILARDSIYDKLPLLTLNINIEGDGWTDPIGYINYKAGDEITITAEPNEGWFFDKWYLDNVDIGNQNPLILKLSN